MIVSRKANFLNMANSNVPGCLTEPMHRIHATFCKTELYELGFSLEKLYFVLKCGNAIFLVKVSLMYFQSSFT